MGNAYIDKRAGVSCLMSAVILSHGKRQLMCGWRGCALIAESCPSPVFPPNFGGLATLAKLNTEICIFHSYAYIRTTGSAAG